MTISFQGRVPHWNEFMHIFLFSFYKLRCRDTYLVLLGFLASRLLCVLHIRDRTDGPKEDFGGDLNTSLCGRSATGSGVP
jgi:hypothetical protein